MRPAVKFQTQQRVRLWSSVADGRLATRAPRGASALSHHFQSARGANLNFFHCFGALTGCSIRNILLKASPPKYDLDGDDVIMQSYDSLCGDESPRGLRHISVSVHQSSLRLTRLNSTTVRPFWVFSRYWPIVSSPSLMNSCSIRQFSLKNLLRRP